MLTIPNSIKTLFKTDGTRKNFRVQFPNGELPDITNGNIVRESVHFTESICSQSTFRFGLAEASVIEFETVGIGNMYGYTIECAYEIDTSSLSASEIASIQSDPGDGELVLASASDIGYGFYRIPLGVFRVERCPRNHGAMTHRQVTAYTKSTDNEWQTMPFNLPMKSVGKAINIDLNALKALDDESLLVQRSTFTSISSDIYRYTFYDSSGNPHFFNTGPNCRVSCAAVNGNSIGTFNDFLRVSVDYDPDEYYAQGVSLAQAIDNAGLEIRYNSKRQQIFETTLDALKAKMPFLFYPQIGCRVANSKDSDGLAVDYYDAFAFSPVVLGGLMPVYLSSDAISFLRPGFSTNLAFDWQCDAKSYIQQCNFYFTGTTNASGTATIHYSEPDGSYISLNMNACHYENLSGTLYRLSSYSDKKIKFYGQPSTPQIATVWWSGFNVSDMHKYEFPDFSYGDLANISKVDLLGGMLETEGRFSKDDRKGSRETFALSPSSPISISPGDYDEVWWDEYDVSPIGTVTVTYRNGEEGEATANVTLRAGASLYDMTDNEVLKNLSTADLDSITTLLSGDFATNAQNVGFTPIEMTMQGWPWLEAGDALQITAEDGTVVNTYALRVEMSGIQHLMSDITAEGGEIIGEV